MTTSVSPGLALIVGGLLLPLLRGRGRELVLLALPIVTLALVWAIPDGSALTLEFLGRELVPVRATPVGRLFATVFCLMTFAGALFALRQASLLELVSALCYAGSAIGVTLAGDLITLFVFWELMAIGSTAVIWASDQPGAYAASIRYLIVHLLGGMLLMVGIAAHVADTGSIAFTTFASGGAARWLILAGFLVNAGAPPLSAWIADAYPEASPSGMVFLSAFTTKTAVYALLVGFPGTWVLIPVGLYMVFYGIIYALLENDMRRILAYSIVNQVGFMVTGIGIGTEMALNGAAAHAFAHIIYKALLLMSAGSVLYVTGRRKCTELGGLFRTMPVTTLCGIVGALAISSFPFTSGFVSKSMVSQAAADGHLALIWLLLGTASAGVPLYAGIKFPWFVFFQRDSGLRPPEPPRLMLAPMWLFAFLSVAIGIFPAPLYALLPYPVTYEPYTLLHVMAYLQLLLFAGLAFFVMLPLMQRTETISLDLDWLYRRPFAVVIRGATRHFTGARKVAEWAASGVAQRLAERVTRAHGLHGPLARSRPTGSMLLWVVLLLGALVILESLRLR